MQLRYALYTEREELEEIFHAHADPSLHFKVRYNISEGDTVPVIISRHPGKYLIESMEWDKSETDNDKITGGYSLDDINNNDNLKKIFQRQRCIIPANGFFLWQKMYKLEVPFYIRSIEDDVIGIAGFYHVGQDNASAGTFSLIRIQANTLIQPIQEHMPAVLNPKNYGQWLDPFYSDIPRLTGLLAPYSTEKMSVYRVSDTINDPSQNSKDLIQPADA